MTRRNTLHVLALAAILAVPATAQAQNPCVDTPITQFVFNPNRLVSNLPEHNATLADGGPTVTDYQMAFFLEGQDPNGAGVNPIAPPATVAKSAFTPLPATTPVCYETPMTPPANPGRIVGALRGHRAARTGLEESFGLWSVATNPFGPDPSAPAAPGGTRVIRR